MLDLPDNVLLHGYWQSPAYFDDIFPLLRRELRLRDPLPDPVAEIAREIDDGAPPVAVHVRRGDYVSDPAVTRVHGALDLSYYRQAISHVVERVGDCQVWVFSDDPDWCRDNLDVEVPTFLASRGHAAHHDLELMRRCGHHVIANSSFSWWGAYLGRHDQQVVVAPNQWFADRLIDPAMRFPAGWTTL